MVLFSGSPTNLIICDVFNIDNAVFSTYTTLPFVACSTFCITIMMLQFWYTKHIPSQQLSITVWTVPPEGLQAPASTIIGCIFLVSCLSASLLFGFLHIDAWKIFLFFALLKFIVDIFCDHCQFSGASLTSSQYIPVELSSLDFTAAITTEIDPETRPTPSEDGDSPEATGFQRGLDEAWQSFALWFPTLFHAIPRLPFALIPLTFSQFILLEALDKNGWVEVFGEWLAIASGGNMAAVIWLVGVTGVSLCNIGGTNIGTTILLAKVIQRARLDGPSERGAAIALAVVSNIGAISLTFSSSLPGMIWRSILQKEEIKVARCEFAKWNLFPFLAMTWIGLIAVRAEMAVLG